MLAIGDKAPEFKLKNDSGEEISLKDLKAGQIPILVFLYRMKHRFLIPLGTHV